MFPMKPAHMGKHFLANAAFGGSKDKQNGLSLQISQMHSTPVHVFQRKIRSVNAGMKCLWLRRACRLQRR